MSAFEAELRPFLVLRLALGAFHFEPRESVAASLFGKVEILKLSKKESSEVNSTGGNMIKFISLIP
jgi:hypothetical protein